MNPRKGLAQKIRHRTLLAVHKGLGNLTEGQQQFSWKTPVFQTAAHLIEHGVAHKGDVGLPGIGNRRAARAEALRVRPQGQIKNMLKACAPQACDIVRVPGEQRRPGTDATRVKVDDQMRIVHEPGGQRQLQPGQQVHEHPFHVHAHVVERDAAVGPERNHGLQQPLDKILAGQCVVLDGDQLVGEAQLAAGPFQFAHQEIFAGQQKHARRRLAETGLYRAAPKVKPGAGGELFTQLAVIGAVQAQIKGQGQGQQAFAVMARLPVGQLVERRLGVGRVHQKHALPQVFRQGGQHAGQLLQTFFFFHHGDGAVVFFKQKMKGVPQARAQQHRQSIPALFRRKASDHGFFPLHAAGTEHGERTSAHMGQHVGRDAAGALAVRENRLKERGVLKGHFPLPLSAGGRGSTIISS